MPEAHPLSGDERQELRDAASAVDLDDLTALHDLVEAVRAGELDVDDETAFHLGAWWGEQVRKATGWKWWYVRYGEGIEAPALVPKDRSTACLPLQWVADALFGHRDNDLVVTVERLRRGERPRGEPGTFALFG